MRALTAAVAVFNIANGYARPLLSPELKMARACYGAALSVSSEIKYVATAPALVLIDNRPNHRAQIIVVSDTKGARPVAFDANDVGTWAFGGLVVEVARATPGSPFTLADARLSAGRSLASVPAPSAAPDRRVIARRLINDVRERIRRATTTNVNERAIAACADALDQYVDVVGTLASRRDPAQEPLNIEIQRGLGRGNVPQILRGGRPGAGP